MGIPMLLLLESCALEDVKVLSVGDDPIDTPTSTPCEPVQLYADADGDGFGAEAGRVACDQTTGDVAQGGDCDDTRRDVFPGAAEVCDLVDQDCNSQIDDNAVDAETWHQDADGDTYGNPATATIACDAPEGFIADDTDCDDTDPTIHPGATDSVDDDIDQDCSGTAEHCWDDELGEATGEAVATGDTTTDDADLTLTCGTATTDNGDHTWHWTAATTGIHEVWASEASYDIVLARFTDDCAWTEHQCNDDDPVANGANARLSFWANAGDSYVFAVDGDGAGTYTLDIQAPRTTHGTLAAGYEATMWIQADGSLWAGGDDDLVTAVPPGVYTQVSAGDQVACALDAAGLVTCWGDDRQFPEALVPPAGAFRQVQAGYGGACAADADDEVTCWGYTEYTQPPAGPIAQLMSLGYVFGAAIDDRGEVSWYDHGRSGRGEYSQVSMGYYAGCAIDTARNLDCWGESGYEDVTAHPSGEFIQVAVGKWQACALTADLEVECWGNTDLAYWLDDAPGGEFVEVSSNYYQSCARNSAGTVTCWGNSHAWR